MIVNVTISKKDCNDKGVYNWWRKQAGLDMQVVEPAVGIGKRLLEAKGITVDKAKVEAAFIQLQNKRIDDGADSKDVQNMKTASKYGFWGKKKK